MSTERSLIGDPLATLVRAVGRHPIIVIVGVMLLASGAGRYVAGNLGINTDTANMISPELEWRRDFIAFREAFPARDRNIIVAVDAANPDVATDAARALAATLAAQPAHFESVFLAGFGEFFDRNGLLYLSLGQLESLSDDLVAAQPLVGRLSRGFGGAAVLDVAAMAVTADELSVADGIEGLLGEIALTIEADADGASRLLRWQSLFEVDAASTATPLLLLRPVLDFGRVQPAAAAIDAIRDAAEQVSEAAAAPVTVRLSGTVAMEHEELISVTRGAAAAGIAALVMVVVVLLWTLRSVVLLIVSILTLLTGLVFTAAFAAFAVGHLNLISVAFAVLYVGLGVDFILHFCLRHKELLATGIERVEALARTAHGVGASLVICAVTTAAGFFAFMPTDFDGVSELGLISGGGMFISLVASLVLLPALLAVAWRPAGEFSAASARLPVRAFNPARAGGAARVVVVMAAALSIASLLALPGLEFDSNPIHLRDPESESVRLLSELAERSEAPMFSMLAIAEDRTDVDRWRAALAADPLVDRVVGASSLVPGDQEEKLLVLDDLRFVLGAGFGNVTAQAFDATQLERAMRDLLTAVRGESVAGAPRLAAAIERWLGVSAATDAAGGVARAAALDRALRSDFTTQIGRLAAGLDAEPFTVSDLPAALAERWIGPDGRELVEFVPAEDLNDNEAASRFVDAVRAVVPNATGLPVVYREASRTIVGAFRQALSLALGVVAILLLILLRRIGDTILVLLPILFASATTAAIAVWFGLPFNFANIIALPLLIGVGVDNGIHIVHRNRTEPREGGTFATSTSRAVLASGLTTIASFGNLAFSSHVGTASMGKLLTIGMLVTLAATLILLPSLLALRKRT